MLYGDIIAEGRIDPTGCNASQYRGLNKEEQVRILLEERGFPQPGGYPGYGSAPQVDKKFGII